ncbi:hypothetical protein [Mycobacteroides abscessus]|uniref:hypothetical protein n=1 Tax=Mycobacteroides abscessus TaxID=36809 RepID=UPI0021042B41|nr:hypothetical protein [Mycobacteroides abscessus]
MANSAESHTSPAWVKDVFAGLGVLVAIVSLTITSILAYKQLQTGRETSALNNQNQVLQLEEQDRSFLSGMSIHIDHDVVSVINNNSQTLVSAGFWAIGDQVREDATAVLVERYSTLAPLVACSKLSFPTYMLAPEAKFESAFLVYKVPSGRWWGISNDNLLEASEYRGDDPLAAASALPSNQLIADTVGEGYNEDDSDEIQNGTGPVPANGKKLYGGAFGIEATSTVTDCKSR